MTAQPNGYVPGFDFILQKMNEGFVFKERAGKGAADNKAQAADNIAQAVSLFANVGVTLKPGMLNRDGSAVKMIHPDAHFVNPVIIPWGRDITKHEAEGFNQLLAEQAELVKSRGLTFDRSKSHFGVDVIMRMIDEAGWEIDTIEDAHLGKGSKSKRDNLSQAQGLFAKKGIEVEQRAFNKDVTALRLTKQTDNGERTLYVPWGRDLQEDELIEIETAEERYQGQDRRAQMTPRAKHETGERPQIFRNAREKEKARYRKEAYGVALPTEAKFSSDMPKNNKRKNVQGREKNAHMNGRGVIKRLLSAGWSFAAEQDYDAAERQNKGKGVIKSLKRAAREAFRGHDIPDSAFSASAKSLMLVSEFGKTVGVKWDDELSKKALHIIQKETGFDFGQSEGFDGNDDEVYFLAEDADADADWKAPDFSKPDDDMGDYRPRF